MIEGKDLQKVKIEVTENQSLEFLFGEERIVITIENDTTLNKDFDYSQNGKEGKLTFYNIIDKRVGVFVPAIKFEEKNIMFNYNIEKKEDKYLFEYSWSMDEKSQQRRKKSFFEKIFGPSKSLSVYMAGFIAIMLIIDIVVLTFMNRIEYENFWSMSTHIITCCLGYLFGSKNNENNLARQM